MVYFDVLSRGRPVVREAQDVRVVLVSLQI